MRDARPGSAASTCSAVAIPAGPPPTTARCSFSGVMREEDELTQSHPRTRPRPLVTSTPDPYPLPDMPLPPGPEGLPAINMVRWVRDPFGFLDRARARFGDSFTMRLAMLTVVVVSEPEAVKQVFALGAEEAHAGEANAVLKPFLGPNSLILLDRAPHQRHRKMMQPAFHGERMHTYGRTMIDLASDS